MAVRELKLSYHYGYVANRMVASKVVELEFLNSNAGNDLNGVLLQYPSPPIGRASIKESLSVWSPYTMV